MDAANKEKTERSNLSEEDLDNKIRLEMKKREITRKLKGESR